MATWKLRRFASLDVLQQIRPDDLLAFLRPHARYLAARGHPLPGPAGPAGFDHLALGRVFLAPDARTPAELIDALHCVDEMSTDDGAEALVAAAGREGVALDLPADVSPADVAVRAWLRAPDLARRKHAEACLAKVRSYEYFQTDLAAPAAPGRLDDLVADLDDGFDAKRRGRGVRVLTGEHDRARWFVVRHPEPIKREESLTDGRPSSVCYRPVKYDVVTYTPATRELAVHAARKGEKELYREAFGVHLFGDPRAFPVSVKYTLDPLWRDGPDALACGDVDGVEWVTLREVQAYTGGDPWQVETRKSNDLFRLLAARGTALPAGRLIRATFQVKFADARTPRAVVVRPSNVAQYARDGDAAVVEAWLAKRGFILTHETDGDDRPRPVLAGPG